MNSASDDCCSNSAKDGNGTFDLAVIGAGSAGFAAAIRASELGARVALVGAGTVGGTCVNVGCVPSKTLIRAAEAHHRATHPGFRGIESNSKLTDRKAVIEQKRLMFNRDFSKQQSSIRNERNKHLATEKKEKNDESSNSFGCNPRFAPLIVKIG